MIAMFKLFYNTIAACQRPVAPLLSNKCMYVLYLQLAACWLPETLSLGNILQLCKVTSFCIINYSNCSCLCFLCLYYIYNTGVKVAEIVSEITLIFKNVCYTRTETNKNLAIANRSRVSRAHNTLRAFIRLNITQWPWNLG